jgi:predicted nucleotide-binding protein
MQSFSRTWNRLRSVVDGLAEVVAASPKELAPIKMPVATVQRVLAAQPVADEVEDIEYHLVRVELYTSQWRATGESMYVPPKWISDADHEALEACRLLADLKKHASALQSLETKDEAVKKSSRPVDHNNKAAVFIGSSKEGLPAARVLQVEMDYEAEVTIWYQGVFGLSGGTLESLVKIAPNFDFAVLVLTPDDLLSKRDKVSNAPRDNVLFELGLFMGVLGRERTYIVHPRVEIELPSDLAGITTATYDSTRRDGNLQAAVGVPATKIMAEIRLLGRR